ncbi:hypothetical protein ACUOE0_003454 [Vibrio vulnificus]
MKVKLALDDIEGFKPPQLPLIIAKTSFNDRAKAITSSVLGIIPKAGSPLKFLLGIFWPSSDDDLWEKIEKNVSELIDIKLTQYSADIVTGGLESAKQLILEVVDLETEEFKIDLFDANYPGIHKEFVDLKNKYFTKTYGEHLLQIIVVAAHMELSFYRLALDSLEENHKFYDKLKKDLEESVQDYHDIISNNFRKWRVWRKNSIKITPRTSKVLSTSARARLKKKYHFKVQDTVIDGKFTELTSFNEERGKKAAKLLKECYYNEAVAEMVIAIQSSALFIRYCLGKENAIPVTPIDLDHRFMGPYFFYKHLESDINVGEKEKPGRIVSHTVGSLIYKKGNLISLLSKHCGPSGEIWERGEIPEPDVLYPFTTSIKETVVDIKDPINKILLEHNKGSIVGISLFAKSEPIEIEKTMSGSIVCPIEMGPGYEITDIQTNDFGVLTGKNIRAIKFRFDYSDTLYADHNTD